MRRAFRALGITTALVAAGGLLIAGTAVATAKPARDGDPTAGAPAVGDCYDLTLKQAWGLSSPESPVDCATKHTMVVTAVAQIPASVDWADVDPNGPFPKALSQAIAKTCAPAAVKLLGPVTRQALSLYSGDYGSTWLFAPTDADVAAGARWFSCLVALDEGSRLVPIPQGQPKKLGAHIPDEVGRCFKRSKGGYPTVVCSSPHQWRATYAQVVTGKLTAKNLDKAAGRICPKHVPTDGWLRTAIPNANNSFVLVCAKKTQR